MKRKLTYLFLIITIIMLTIPILAVTEVPKDENINTFYAFVESFKDECLYLVRIAPTLLVGSLSTIKLFLVSILCSLPLGFLLCMQAQAKNIFAKKCAGTYIYIMRGTPLLLQLLAIYFGFPYLPLIGNFLKFDRFTAACIAFVLNYAAYFAEIFRGGFISIDKGQYEAAKVLGISRFDTMVRIIIPQMIRVALPSIANETITLVKDTALIYAIAIPELLHAAKVAVNRDFKISPFVLAALIYLAMTFVLTMLFRKIEKKTNYNKNAM